jgi:RNase P subunit RPR2
MTTNQTARVLCPKCHSEMRYITAMPHPNAPQMQRTTFVCCSCNKTRKYMLSAAMANAYAAASAVAV